jgi:RHS repeat-associated protein
MIKFTAMRILKSGFLSLIFAVFLLGSRSYGQQLTVVEAADATQVQTMVNGVLLGKGVTVSNITYSGNFSSIGSFTSSGSTIGLNNGLLLSTGKATDASGPNDVPNFGGTAQGTAGDADLSTVINGTTFDASVLEFDFVPSGNKVRFRYVFASEEYPDYVCSTVNDVFAFFVSRPGIAGKTNIAMVNGFPVSINTVNCGPGTAPEVNPVNCAANLCSLYVDNSESAVPVSSVQYDGHTVVLIAEMDVIPCAVYHIKMAIADAGDNKFDSGVFLEAQSFASDPVLISLAGGSNTICQGNTASLSALAGYHSYQWKKGGVAISGATGNTYDANAAGSYTVDVKKFACNAVAETSNPIAITVQQPPVKTLSSTGTSLCLNSNITITATQATGTYHWNTPQEQTTRSITVNTPGTYNATITEGVCTVVSDNITLTGNEHLLEALKTDITCKGLTDGSINLTVSGGLAPYTFSWTGPNNFTSAQEDLSNLAAGNYIVTVVDANTCSKTLSVSIIEPLQLTANAVTGPDRGSAVLTVFGGTPPYTYNWTLAGQSVSTEANPKGLATGYHTVTVTDAHGCTATSIVQINNGCTLEAAGLITAITCPGFSNGSIEINVIGGSGNYSYAWLKDGQSYATGKDISSLSAGSYKVIITDTQDNCELKKTFSLPDPVFSLDVATGGVNCFGAGNGTASPVITGGTSPFTYSWLDNTNTEFSTAESLNNLSPGSYTLKVTDDKGCMQTKAFGIGGADGLEVDLVKTDITCFGLNDGRIDMSILGGTAPYTITWYLPDASTSNAEDLSALAPGTYSVNVTDINQCTATVITAGGVVEILEPTLLSSAVVAGMVRGTADLSVTGGTEPYAFLWSNGETEEDPDNLQDGVTYTYTVTDARGCTSTGNFTPDEGCTMGVIVDAQTEVSCYGGSDGTASVTVSGGAGSYTYSWKNSANTEVRTTEDVTGMLAGTYSLKVTDPSDNCQVNISVSIIQPLQITGSLVKKDIICHSQINGTITAQANGGTTPLVYTWKKDGLAYPAGSNPRILTDLGAGSYELTVTDSRNCQLVLNTVIVDPQTLEAIATPAHVLCRGAATGSIGLNLNGGWAPYTYSWTGPDNFTASTQNIQNLKAGSYSVTVTDALGCTTTASATITEPATELMLTLDSQTNLTCFGGSNGTISVSASGGTGSHTWLWTSSGTPVAGTSTDEDQTQLRAGTYTVTVTDANGCSKSLNITLTQPEGPSVTSSGSASFCTGESVVLSSTIAGDSYSWTKVGETSPVGTNATYTATLGGFYRVEVTRPNGCVELSPAFQVTVNNRPTVLIQPSRTDFCEGSSVTLTASISGVSYNWTLNGNPIPGVSAQKTITASEGGTYSLSVNTRLCQSVADQEVLNKHSNFSLSASPSPATCPGAANGSVSLSTTGGVAPFVYDWAHIAGSSDVKDLVNVVAGNYSVTVSDNVGCQRTASAIVEEPLLVVQSTLVHVNCFGADNGSISLNVNYTPVSGGNPANCTASWADGPTGNTRSNLGAGTYTANISCGACTKSFSYTITEPADISIVNTVANVTCSGAANGSIQAAVSGGTPSYTYAWTGTAQNSATITGLAPGTYALTVTDSKGCVKNAPAVSITQPSLLTGTLSKTDAACIGGNNGSAQVSATGGVQPYTYTWTGSSQTTASISNLIKGTYSVVVKDQNNCTFSGSVTVGEANVVCGGPVCSNFRLDLSATNASCTGRNNGTIVPTVSGATGVVSYDWAHIAGTSNSSNPGLLAPGTYTLTASTPEGCSQTASATIADGTSACPRTCDLITSIVGTNVTCPGGTNGAANLVIQGGLAPYKIDWLHLNDNLPPSGGDREDLTGLRSGPYTAVVTDATGTCSYTSTVSITEPYPMGISGNASSLCPGKTAVLTSHFGGANLWSTGETTRSITVSAPGIYSVSAPGACSTLTASINILPGTACNEPSLLCNAVAFPIIEVSDSCTRDLVNTAMYNARQKYNSYIEEAKESFQTQYIAKCLDVYEDFSIKYIDKEHHNTLYYYDQAGNLVRTIPPAGVVPITDVTKLAQAKIDRKENQRTVFTSHTMATTYTYNSLNQLVAQNVPDHQTMDISGTASLGTLPIAGLQITGTQFTGGGNGFLTANQGGTGYIFSTTDGGKTWSELSKIGTMDLLDVHMEATGIGYAVGDRGTLLKTTDNGLTWLIIPLGTAADIEHVYFFNDAHGLIYDKSGNIWESTDAGLTWQAVGSLLSQLGGKLITDISFTSDNLAYLTASDAVNGYIYTSSAGNIGIDWSAQTSIRGTALTKVQMLNSSNGVAAGTDGNIFISTDAGNQWKAASGGLTGTISDMYFRDLNMGVILSGGNLSKTLDGGRTWAAASTGTSYADIDISRSNNGYAIKTDGSIEFTSNGGLSWTAKVKPAYVGTYTSVSYRTNLDAYAGTQDGKLFVSADGAATWKEISTTGIPTAAAIRSIHFKTKDIGCLLTAGGKIYMTTNATAVSPAVVAWTEVSPGTGFTDMYFDDADKGYVINPNGSVKYSGDGGQSWPSVNVNGVSPTSSAASVNFVANKVAVVTGEGKIFISDDAGQNWTEKGAGIVPPVLNGIHVTSSAQTGYAVGKDGTVLKTTDNGTLWTMQATGRTSELADVHFSSAAAGIAVSTGGEIWFTSSGAGSWTLSTSSAGLKKASFGGGEFYVAGQAGTLMKTSTGTSWTSLTSGTTEQINGLSFVGSTAVGVCNMGKIIRSVNVGPGATAFACVTNVDAEILYASDMVDGSIGYAVGKDGSVVKTSNGGITWVDLNAPTTKTLRGVDFIDANNGVAVGDNGTIIRTTTGGADNFNKSTGSVPSNLNFKDVQMLNSSLGFAVGANASGNGVVYKTSDGGANWTLEHTASGSNSGFNSVYFTDRTFGFAVGDNGTVYKAALSGSVYSFTQVTDPDFGTKKFNDVHFVDYTIGYIVGDNGVVLKTIGGGGSNTWEDDNSLLNTTDDLLSMSFNDRNNLVITGTGSSVTHLNDETDQYSSKFWYDELGRVVASQNSKQFSFSPKQGYSYILYDDLGRITEVGEVLQLPSDPITEVTKDNNNSQIKTPEFLVWLNTGEKSQITKTYYDEPVYNVPGLVQERLRNRVVSVTYQQTSGNAYDHASHYSYDIHGNVKTLIQDNPSLAIASESANRYKRIDYEYDLISDKVNLVKYQEGKPDQFYHQYEYDVDNMITQVLTSQNGIAWNRDAKYFYYDHGPLARTEIGHDKVQGMDYAYTMQGWVKGVNSNTLDATRDQGNDANTSLSGVEGLNKNVAKDAFGYSLNYFDGDYKPVGTIADIDNFIASTVNLNSAFLSDAPGLFNGNISSMATAISDADPSSATFGQVQPQITAYRYDQLNRIKQMKAYRDINLATNTWNAGNDGSYQENFTYDANGNIKTLERNGRLKTTAPTSPLAMDKLEYKYENIANSYNRNTNKLRSVDDLVPDANYSDDIDDQDPDNYEYDPIGNLKKDAQEEIDNIEWNVGGKITKVLRIAGSAKPDLEFAYDATGNRVSKIVKPAATKTDASTWTTTYYVRDASGNVMATYEKKKQTQVNIVWKEQMIYGSSRIGLVNPGINLSSGSILSTSIFTSRLGIKTYEGPNHLGNVLTAFSDRKIPVVSGTTITSFNADILTTSDYYAFGSSMPGRGYKGIGYRYGFNGKESTDEWNGGGAMYDYGFRIYDPRIGKFLSVDPLSHNYPWYSPYAFAGDMPISAIDLDGLELKVVVHYLDQEGNVKSTKVHIIKDFHVELEGKKYAQTEVYYIFEDRSYAREYIYERIYENGEGPKPSAAYNYTEDDQHAKQKEDLDYIGNGKDGISLYRFLQIYSRDEHAPDNQKTVDDLEVLNARRIYSGRNKPVSPTTGITPKKNLKYKLGPNDVDYRGQKKSYKDAVDEAFNKTGQKREEFEITKWAKDKNGKSVPVEYRHKSGAEVSVDYPHRTNGPDAPHVGWQTGGKRDSGGAKRGHIILDEVPAGR